MQNGRLIKKRTHLCFFQGLQGLIWCVRTKMGFSGLFSEAISNDKRAFGQVASMGGAGLTFNASIELVPKGAAITELFVNYGCG